MLRVSPSNGGGGAAATQDVAVVSPSVMVGLGRPRNLIIEGRIEAQVALHAHHVSVADGGSVSADVHGEIIRVAGEVNGNLFGREQVVVSRSGRVRGNIAAPEVVLEEGASFEGRIEIG